MHQLQQRKYHELKPLQLQSNEDVFCEKCLIFRPVEMYKKILHHPMNVTDEELASLNERRVQEKRLILERDLECKEEKVWFMLSCEWLAQWKSFISNKISSSLSLQVSQSSDLKGSVEGIKPRVRLSENPRIGVLPPGPITNDDLFVKVLEGKEYVQ